MRKYFSFFLGFIIILTFSCKADQNIAETIVLEGNWLISEAYRNNEITSTLDGGYFKFTGNQMETNIMGAPVTGAFELNGNIINHASEPSLIYTASKYSGDSLQLDTQIEGYKFMFKLIREKSAEPED